MAQDRYQWLFRKIPVVATSTDWEGRFVDVSDTCVARLGFERTEMIGRRVDDFCSAEYVKLIREEYVPQLRRTGYLRDVPIQMQTRSAERVEFLASAISEYDWHGNHLSTVQVYTERGSRAALEQRYRNLYRATPAMLHTVDRQGRIIAVSDWWLEKLGYQRDEVMGRSIMEFMSEETRESLAGGRLEAIIHSGQLRNEPRKMLTKKGEIVDVLISASPERDHRGGVDRMLVALKDVTERNIAEEKMREAYDEVARLKEELEQERDYLREEVNVSMNFGQIVGQSPALTVMLEKIEAVAATSANVLILGESGVGKELVAHAIHSRSLRAKEALVKVNCASIPRELFESEFFGHVKGAFTGAHRDRIGRFQLADGGTLFLDEVAEIPIELQGKLLRVLQEQELERVGEDETRRVDVRVIAASNRDLEKAVEAGQFREDLYYRLSVFPISVPPLRKRRQDILQLATHFLDQACQDSGRQRLKLTQHQAEVLETYDWPGNVRELRNVIERAVILSKGRQLRLDLALPTLTPTHLPGDQARMPDQPADFVTEGELKRRQRDNMLAALQHAGWKVSGSGGAAELLGIKPSTLSDRMKALGIVRPSARLR